MPAAALPQARRHGPSQAAWARLGARERDDGRAANAQPPSARPAPVHPPPALPFSNPHLKADIEKERQEQMKGPAAKAREFEELVAIYVAVGGGCAPA